MPTASRAEYLTIGSVIIGTKAAWCLNLHELYGEAHRGSNSVVPESAGTIANPRRLDEVEFVLELVIDGHYDSDGASNANAHTGVRANIAELKGVTSPVTTGGGTRTVTWTRPGSANVSAACHVGPLIPGEAISDAVIKATVDLLIPAGQFS